MLCFSEELKHNMASLSILKFFFLLSFFIFAESGSIGINYGRVADNLPPPSQVVQLLKSHGITRTKIFDTASEVLTALANSNISVVVALPNELLSSVANSPAKADSWVQANISPYYPATQFEAIAVGNEVFAATGNLAPFLVPAMKNIRASLVQRKLNSIKVSTPLALSALQSSYPPSSGSFKSEYAGPVIKPMLEFIGKTGSYLMVNAYPFFAYAANADKISLSYALFQQNPGVVDPGNGLRYMSLLEAQLDAVYAAMSALHYDDVKLVVSETGWPSQGGEDEVGASIQNAMSYNDNLVQRVLTGKGTPSKPDIPLDVFIFALFNEDLKTGPISERNYGLFYPNEQKVYDIKVTSTASGEARGNQTTTPGGGNKSQEPTSSLNGQSWCVAKPEVGQDKLQAGLDYACGEGGADCRPIHKDSTCYDPDTLEAHASYAFNSYYQKHSRSAGTCDFGGAAYVVNQPPRFGTCEYPTSY